jgi:hypothetical protein
MISWLSWFISDLFYWIAVIALCVGAIAYSLSYFVGFIPMLKAHALLMKVVGMALVISGGFYVSDHHGYQRRVDEDQAEIERLNAEARAKEAELDKAKKEKSQAIRKANDAIAQKKADINFRVDTGELRLPTSCGVQASSDAGTSSGNPTNGTDIERQTIKALADIASDGDKAIVQLNACIDFYQTVKGKVNEMGK